MFGATPGMTEAELIDFIAEKRQRANTYEELQPDGTSIIRSTKTMEKRVSVISCFPNNVLLKRALVVLCAQ